MFPRRVATHVCPVGAHPYFLGTVRTDGQALVEGVLGKYVQINIVTLFNLLPGETTQNLRQDDGLWPIPRPHLEFVCNALIAIDDFDVENGATNIVPYSHTWHDRPVDQSVETLQVTMRSGSMLVWAGSLWHAGGANTSRDRERLGLFYEPQRLVSSAAGKPGHRRSPRGGQTDAEEAAAAAWLLPFRRWN